MAHINIYTVYIYIYKYYVSYVGSCDGLGYIWVNINHKSHDDHTRWLERTASSLLHQTDL